MKYSEIVRRIDEIMYYLMHHNKNMTKAQDALIEELQDLIHELRIKQDK